MSQAMSIDEGDDRIEDGLATGPVGGMTLSQEADALLAEVPGANAQQIPQPAQQPAQPADDKDATGECASSRGSSTGDEEYDDDDDDDDDDGETTNVESLMEKGGLFMSGIPQSQEESQTLDDGDDYMEEKVRKDCANIQTATWMEKKVNAKTGAWSDPIEPAFAPDASGACSQMSSASCSSRTRRVRRIS